MSQKIKRYTLKDIAEQTGFGRSTVSLALRNHPSLPEATRKTIQEAAVKMGYRPNPLISALMTQIRSKRKKHRERIAIISRFSIPLKTTIGQNSFYSILYAAIVEQAARHGYDVEEFHFDPKAPLSDRRMSDILLARGIHGVLFFPGNNVSADADYPTLQWEHFAVVLIGFNTRHIALHQITSHYSYDMDLALKHASASQLSPIGLVVSGHHNVVTDFGWTARYLLYQSTLPQRERIPYFEMIDNHPNREPFLKWFAKYRPKVLLISHTPLEEWLLQAGYRIPEDVNLIYLTVRGETPRLAGIDPYTHQVGHAAVELLVTLLQTNQRGIPQFPQTISIKGRWSPGDSFPESAQSKEILEDNPISLNHRFNDEVASEPPPRPKPARKTAKSKAPKATLAKKRPKR